MDKKLINRFRNTWPLVLKKWENRANGVGVNPQNIQCEFCQISDQIYDTIIEIDPCVGCPIYLITGKDMCRGIDYRAWFNSVYDISGNPYDTCGYPATDTQNQAKRIYNKLLEIKIEWDKLYLNVNLYHKVKSVLLENNGRK